MIAIRKNLAIDKGATFNQTFRFLDSERQPYDLTSYTGWFRIYERGVAGEMILEVPLVMDSEGNMEVYIADEETQLLDAELRAYTLEIEDPAGDIERLLFGQLQVRSATRV